MFCITVTQAHKTSVLEVLKCKHLQTAESMVRKICLSSEPGSSFYFSSFQSRRITSFLFNLGATPLHVR